VHGRRNDGNNTIIIIIATCNLCLRHCGHFELTAIRVFRGYNTIENECNYRVNFSAEYEKSIKPFNFIKISSARIVE